MLFQLAVAYVLKIIHKSYDMYSFLAVIENIICRPVHNLESYYFPIMNTINHLVCIILLSMTLLNWYRKNGLCRTHSIVGVVAHVLDKLFRAA